MTGGGFESTRETARKIADNVLADPWSPASRVAAKLKQEAAKKRAHQPGTALGRRGWLTWISNLGKKKPR